MTRDEVYRDMEETLGLVPSFFKNIPDATLEHDWEAFKGIQMKEGAVPNKYKELIGLGISAVTKCRYCTLFHTEMAKMAGATDEEIAEVLRYTGNSVLWSAWLNGNQTDFTEFRDELRKMIQFMKSKAGMAEAHMKASI